MSIKKHLLALALGNLVWNDADNDGKLDGSDNCSLVKNADQKNLTQISVDIQQLADKAKRMGIKRFIYASSGSVYGIKDEEQVTEDLELKPISEYNKTKMVAERVADLERELQRQAWTLGVLDCYLLSAGLFVVLLGVWPAPLLDVMRPSIELLVDQLTASKL